MKEKQDPLAEALRGVPVPALDPAVDERVKALARAHLEPASATAPAAVRLRLTLASAAVPGLLALVATDHVAETVVAIEKVYGAKPSDKKRG